MRACRTALSGSIPAALVLPLVVACLFIQAPKVRAAGNTEAKIMLKSNGITVKNPCSPNFSLRTDCSQYDVAIHSQKLYPELYYAYLLVVNGSRTEGVAGIQVGVDYEGAAGYEAGGRPINVFGFTLCATLSFDSPSPAWPAPGSGTIITWDTTKAQCLAPPGNNGVGGYALAGYFYMTAYSPGRFKLGPRPIDGLAKVANCSAAEDTVYVSGDESLTFLGALGFGPNTPGINPCGRSLPVAVAPTSWSGVKTLLGN